MVIKDGFPVPLCSVFVVCRLILLRTPDNAGVFIEVEKQVGVDGDLNMDSRAKAISQQSL